MSDGMNMLEKRIERFEELITEMKEVTREAHSVLKELKKVNKDVERLLTSDAKEMVDKCSSTIIKSELDKLGPIMREQSNVIYNKVGEQIDKLITLSLGNELRVHGTHKDVRPELAAHLRVWIQEIIEKGE